MHQPQCLHERGHGRFSNTVGRHHQGTGKLPGTPTQREGLQSGCYSLDVECAPKAHVLKNIHGLLLEGGGGTWKGWSQWEGVGPGQGQWNVNKCLALTS